MKHILIVIAASLLLFSCEYNGPKILPNISGAAGEVVVVINKTDWDAETGVALHGALSVDEPYLAQREPMFNLVNVPESNFSKIFQTHRNIIIINISSDIQEPSYTHQENIWAAPQTVVTISGASGSQIAQVIESRTEKLQETFLLAEKNRIIQNARKYENEGGIRPTVTEMFGGSPFFPRGYSQRKRSNTNDFIWIANESTYTNQGILIYSFPYIDESSLSLEYLISQRDMMLQANVPGPSPGSYMITNSAEPLGIKKTTFNKMEYIEVRGLWDVQNDFMGGPFVCLFFPDKEKKNIIALDGFVHAPRYEKRNYLRQLEAIIYSFEYKDQSIN